MREAGHSYLEIATKLGYRSQAAAYDAVRRCLETATREAAEACLEVELRRLDRMLAGQMAKIDKGDAKAVESALRILERMGRYTGLDRQYAYVPASSAVAIATTDPAERQAVVEAWLARTRTPETKK